MKAGSEKERAEFEEAVRYAREHPDNSIVYHGTIDSIVEKDGAIKNARLLIEPGQGKPYRVQLEMGLQYFSRFWGGYTGGLFWSRPLIRTFCEIGDEVTAVFWNKEGLDQTNPEVSRNNTVRAYGNHTADAYAVCPELKEQLEQDNSRDKLAESQMQSLESGKPR